MEDIYIIGAGGYVGSYLSDYLSQFYNSKQLILIGNSNSKKNPVYKEFPKKVNKNSICILLAGSAGEKFCNENKSVAFINNVELVKKVIDLNFKKIIFTSTTSLYGKTNKPVDENAPSITSSYYTETKLLAENLLIESKINSIILRLSIIIGNSPNYNTDSLFSKLFFEFNTNKEPIIFDSESSRPYHNIYDTALAIKHFISVNINCYEIFNIGNNILNLKKIDLINSFKVFFPKLKYSVIEKDDNRSYIVNFDKYQNLINEYITIEKTISNLLNINHENFNIRK